MNIWQVLDIDPTNDQTLIRRAYARQLKIHRPDKDPEGYQQLREAFEQAKSQTTVSEPVNHKISSPVYRVIEESFTPSGEQQQTPPPLYTQYAIDLLAKKVVHTEMLGIAALNMQWRRISRNATLSQQHLFHQHFAMALAQQSGLTEIVLERVSAHLDWRLNEYNAGRVLSPQVLEALYMQLHQTELECTWKQLQIDRDQGGYLERLAYKLLLGESITIPLWIRLVPDLFTKIAKKVNDIEHHFPELIARLNPYVVAFVRQKRLALSWESAFLMFFWVFLFSIVLPAAKISVESTAIVLFIFLFYSFDFNIILTRICRWPKLWTSISRIECFLSILIGLLFYGALLWVGIINVMPTYRNTDIMGLVVCLLLFIVFWLSWPGEMKRVRRPGGMLNRIITSPWRILKFFDFSAYALALLPVYFIFLFGITLEMFKLLR